MAAHPADVEGAVPETGVLLTSPVSLGRAARIGVAGGFVAVFLAAVGFVEKFMGPMVVGDLTVGYVFLLLVPLFLGSVAAKPPARLEGYAEPTRGARNVLAGVIVGGVAGIVMIGFVLLITTFNLRRVFINITPALAGNGDRFLTFGRDLGPGILLLLGLGLGLGAVGGALQLLGDRWRRPVQTAALWVLFAGMLEEFATDILGNMGLVAVADFFYGRRGLSVEGAALLGIGVVAASFALRRRKRTVRQRIERLPKRGRLQIGLLGIALAAVLLGLLPSVLGVFLSGAMATAGIFILTALGLNIVVGFAGLLDLGYVAFFAVGAYAMAALTSPIAPAATPELSFWAALPFVMLAAAAAGVIVGTPVLRMRGDYLAIVTLGFGEIVRLLFLSDALAPWVGAARGIRQVPNVNLGTLYVFQGPQRFFYLVAAFTAVAVYVAYALKDSRMGRAWMALREDETVAEAMGVNVVVTKLWAFIIGAIVASLGGALFATRVHSVFPHSFEIGLSITFLIIVIVGGIESIPGVVVGGLVLIGLPEILREFEEFRFLLYGALLILMMLRRPEGLIPSRRRQRELHEEEVSQDVWLREEAEREEAEERGRAIGGQA